MKFFFRTLFFLIISTTCFASPKIFFKDAYHQQQTIAANTMPAAINTFINNLESKNSNLYQIVVHQFHGYDVINLFSNQYWKVTKIRVNLNSTNQITQVIPNYKNSKKELEILAGKSNAPLYPLCPDPSVQYVAISAYPEVGDVKKSVDAVYQAASKKYKAVEILGDQANVQTYLAWLSCPNLKGFYSVGHGDNEDLFVANGETIPYIIFHDERFTGIFYTNKTNLIFNSCEVFNRPFGTEIGFGNAYTNTEFETNPGPTPGVYVGGYTNLMINSSEDISACFMTKVIQGESPVIATLKSCIGNYDFFYGDFGISYPASAIVPPLHHA